MKSKRLLYFMIILAFTLPFPDLRAEEDSTKAATLLLGQSMKMNLTAISGSVKALADTYVRLYDHTPVMSEQDQKRWQARSFSENQTVLFRPFTSGPEPGFQYLSPSYLYYHGKDLTPNVWRELNTFVSLAPMLQLSYDTFNHSWVYLTTKDGAFLIYPYLPLGEAVHNYPPTEQIFYTAADFKNRASGWTPPYLDLAGAGMMVTVSHPIYRQDELLGVVARDITLTQLASQILEPLNGIGNRLIGLIIDKDGMAIASSQAEGMREINTVNSQAKSAVLYYCDTTMLPTSTNTKARSSSIALYNNAGQLALEESKSAPEQTMWQFTVRDEDHQYRAGATRIKATGWFVITLQP